MKELVTKALTSKKARKAKILAEVTSEGFNPWQ